MVVTYSFIKPSILFFSRRLFCVVKWSAFDIISITYIVIIVMWTVIFFFRFLFDCKTKICMLWAPLSDLQQQCGNPLPFGALLGLVISDLGTDIMIVVLPLPIVCSLCPLKYILEGMDQRSIFPVSFISSCAASRVYTQTQFATKTNK